MPIQMSERQVGDVTVVDLSGKLTTDHEAQRLKDKINSLVQQQRNRILINLADVSYIDSGGLGQLVSSYSTVAKSDGRLKLLHVSRKNHDLLAITRLVTIFDSFDSEDEAIKSFI